ncbi:hypothetical protein WS105_0134 [Weissella ceti]|uniref:Uncharacterized protein n=2 Tax=Weissella TaxID=46255 RepID=A0A075TU75_9LACO|nr:hypothetical protein WS08_0135 [Weissella tructae]AIM62386.1 hypothetical protein WS74_0134 [Weissella ceti]AIM63724.1 hypothetical protein WS105_0134 [Weissella ceti]
MSNCETCCCQVTDIELINVPQPVMHMVSGLDVDIASSEEDGPLPVEDEPP